MSIDARLNKVMPALTARERAILVLRSWKEKTPEDPLWRLTLPQNQATEFSRLIDLMNAVNQKIGYLITVLLKETEKLELRLAWLYCMSTWELNLAEIDFAVSLLVREPIRESDYAEHVARSAAEYVPVRALAERLAEEQRAWTDDDLEEVPWCGEPVIKDEAWQRLVVEAEAELRRAAAAGELKSKGRGNTLRVRRGSVDAWLGKEPQTYPEWAGGFDVCPNDDPRVRWDRLNLQHLREALTSMPGGRAVDAEAAEGARSVSGLADRLQQVLAALTASQWLQIRAVEIVLEEAGAEFDGEDPLRPVHRRDLEDARQTLMDLKTYLREYDETFELNEPDSDEVHITRKLLEPS